VSPQAFLDRMTHLWSIRPFNMNTTPALLGGWGVLVDYFHRVICKIARNTDPLRGDFASNSDPS
jgi:hypothetical protein